MNNPKPFFLANGEFKTFSNVVDDTEDPRIIRFPHPAKFKIDYSKMMVGDMWGTVNNQPIALGIKIRTWGILSAFSLSKCNHIAITIKINNQFFLCEALSDGMRISSCYKYLNPVLKNGWNQMCFIGRHRLMTDQDREIINKQCLQLAFDYPEYDAKGVGEFILPNFLHGKDEDFFCSEAGSFVLRNANKQLALSKKNSDFYSPADFQRSNAFNNVMKDIISK